jgi:hypothetical protein
MFVGFRGWQVAVSLGVVFFAVRGEAKPFGVAGDLWLRHDVQMSSDLGMVSAPIMSWPLAFANLGEVYDLGLQGAGSHYKIGKRLRKRLSQEARLGVGKNNMRIELASFTAPWRLFGQRPRDAGTLKSSTSLLFDRAAASLEAAWVRKGEWSKRGAGELRLDGSYAAVLLGNWALTLGAIPRWWGPGWSTSLLLSQNARPSPALSLERLSAEAPQSPVLKWLGRWKLQVLVAQMERFALAFENLYLGLRLELKPHPAIELAFSRVTPWCGGETPCTETALAGALVSQADELAGDSLPAQKNAFDWRVVSPWRLVPLAFYGQVNFVGDSRDKVDSFQFLGGMEAWLRAWGASCRVYGEYIDTRYRRIEDGSISTDAYKALVYQGENTASSLPYGSQAWAMGVSVADPGWGFWSFGVVDLVTSPLDQTSASTPRLQLSLSYRMVWKAFSGQVVGGLQKSEQAQGIESWSSWASLSVGVGY